MNYLPFCGYFFYGGADADETASFASSWGLLATAPEQSVFKLLRGKLNMGLKLILGSRRKT